MNEIKSCYGLRRRYESPVLSPVEFSDGPVCIMAVSVVDHSTVQSASQKKGTSVDFTGESFNHSWETGE